MGHASLRYSIYGWDKPPISQEELSAHEATIDRLLQYSTLGWDKFPISNKVSVIQEMTNHRLLRTRPREVTKLLNPKRSTSSMRRQSNRLLRYSKKQIKTANDKGNQPIDCQLKVLYIRMLKVLQWTPVHTKTKRILQQLFKPLALAPGY